MNKGSRHAIPLCYRTTTILLPTPKSLHNIIKKYTPMSHRYGSTAFLMNTCIGPLQLQLKKL